MCSQPPFVLKLKDRRLRWRAVLMTAALFLALAGHWTWSGFPVALIAGMFCSCVGAKANLRLSSFELKLDEFFGKVPYLRDLQLLEPDLQSRFP